MLAYAGMTAASRALEQWLAAKPERHPEAELRREPQGEVTFVERTDGTRLRAISAGGAGSGQTVVLAHGYGITLHEWNIVWELLRAAGFRVICFDQRGHGQSTIGRDGVVARVMAEDYLAVLRHFDVQDGILVGHSMGGYLAMTALTEIPEVLSRLSGVVLCATFAGQINDGAPQNRVQLPLIEYGILQSMLTRRSVSLLFGMSLCGDHPTLREVELFAELFRAQDHRPLLPILQAFDRETRYGRLFQITLPTVVLCGTKDRTTPIWHAQRIAKEIAGSRLVFVDGVGHGMNWEAPQAIVDAIVSLATPAA